MLMPPLLGLRASGEFPFNRFQGVIGLAGLVIASLIPTTQRRDDELASDRERPTSELGLVAEQKTATIIGLGIITSVKSCAATCPAR